MNLQYGLPNAIDSNSKFGILEIKDAKKRETFTGLKKLLQKVYYIWEMATVPLPNKNM